MQLSTDASLHQCILERNPMTQHNHHQHDHRSHGGHTPTTGKAAHDDAHAGHDKHAGHSVAMFRDKFWLTLLLTIPTVIRSEEHTSELQSRGHLVCRLLLE